jgi:allophanate hydrolase
MLNNLVGLKPSCGRIPTTGVVPACRTLDVMSVFALTAGDAATVLGVAQGEDPKDAYSRTLPPYGHNFGSAASFRFGVPRQADLAFHGNPDGPTQFAQAVAKLVALGGTPVEVDMTPFFAVAKLLYEGPWVAERYQAIRAFIEASPQALHPVTRAITEKGPKFSAPDTFAALYQLKDLERQTRAVWRDIDCLVTPTASTAYTIKAVEADPIALNSNLGHYTNYVNLLDLSAIAVPTGFMGTSMSNMPWGVTLVARAGQDVPLLSLAARLHASTVATVGATPHAPHRLMSAQPDLTHFASGLVTVAVCGAHLSGLPLNWQLTQRGAKLLRTVRSARCYRLFALPGGPPKRPGMLRVDEGGAAIDMEVWALAATEFGSFVAGIPAPLGIGTVLLDDGTSVQGFVCEAHATAQAQDISHFGGWLAYLRDAV